MNKRKILIGLTVAILAAAGAYILLNRSSAERQYLQQSLLPFSQQRGSVYFDTQKQLFIFSNGRQIASYSLLNKETQLLTKTESLPPISTFEPSPDGSYLAFKTDQVSDSNTFTTLLQAKEGEAAEIDTPTWWLLNIKTGEISSIGQNIVDLEWDEKNLTYAYENVVVYRSPEDAQEKELFGLQEDAIVDFRKNNQQLLLYTSQQKVLLVNLENKALSTLDEEIDYALFNRSNSCFISTVRLEDADTSKLSLKNCEKNRGLGTTKEGFFGFSRTGELVAYNDNGELVLNSLNLKSPLITQYSSEEENRVVEVFDKSTVLFNNEFGNFLISVDGALLPKVIEKDETFSENGLDYKLLKNEQFINVSKSGSFSEEDKIKATELLQQRGYDYRLFGIFFEEN